MFSGGSDGQGVEVVGQDAPSGPGLLAVIALQPAAAHAVAAFEVADASFGAGAVALQPSLAQCSGPCHQPQGSRTLTLVDRGGARGPPGW